MAIMENVLINPQSSRPKYQQLKDHLRKELLAGSYLHGDLVPSEKTLIRTTGLASNTVRQALGGLADEGLIERIRGKGTFVTSKIEKHASTAQSDLFVSITPGSSADASGTKGLIDGAESRHHGMMVSCSDNNLGKQGDIILRLIDRGVAGVVLEPPTYPETPAYQVRQLQKHGIPVVFCHRGVAGISAPLVTFDAREAGRMAGVAVAEKGHEVVAYCGSHRYVMTEAFEFGFREGLAQHNVCLLDENVFYGLHEAEIDPSQDRKHNEINTKVFDHVMRLDKRPTAVFCSSEVVGERLVYSSMQHGIKVADELSIITWNSGNLRNSGAFQDHLAKVSCDEYGLSLRLIELLCEIIDGKRAPGNSEVILMPLSLDKCENLAEAP